MGLQNGHPDFDLRGKYPDTLKRILENIHFLLIPDIEPRTIITRQVPFAATKNIVSQWMKRESGDLSSIALCEGWEFRNYPRSCKLQNAPVHICH